MITNPLIIFYWKQKVKQNPTITTINMNLELLTAILTNQ